MMGCFFLAKSRYSQPTSYFPCKDTRKNKNEPFKKNKNFSTENRIFALRYCMPHIYPCLIMTQIPETHQRFKKLMVANRGEIALRVLRAAAELKLRTVAIYTYEDRYSLHRYKSDEAYQIGKDDEPLRPYLDIEEILRVAKLQDVDAIHPGYGFLSENVQFARRCREEGIVFIGPDAEVMDKLGDKVAAKRIAAEVGVPMIPDSKLVLTNETIALQAAAEVGFPLMVKAAAGGGGRGMRVVREASTFISSYHEAQREAKTAFGDDTVFLEKFIDQPKHIEVQILGDRYGNLVHLYERDCSVQRRFQKVVEIAPSLTLSDATREKLYEYALRLTRHVGYSHAGTVEFLVDMAENIYFIEVNPRIQVEHTITEEITGIDIVRSQILIAMGYPLSHPTIFIRSQDDVQCQGYAIQCRITTEDPTNGFKPDYGTLIAYRSPGGFGIRLDAGSAYPGAIVSPFFDSLLVKVTAWGRSFQGAIERLERALSEFRIRGVNTNIGFLQNLLENDTFRHGRCTVNFMGEHPELLKMPRRQDRGTKVLKYLANVIVNGNPDVPYIDPKKNALFRKPFVPQAPQPPKGGLTLGNKGVLQAPQPAKGGLTVVLLDSHTNSLDEQKPSVLQAPQPAKGGLTVAPLDSQTNSLDEQKPSVLQASQPAKGGLTVVPLDSHTNSLDEQKPYFGGLGGFKPNIRQHLQEVGATDFAAWLKAEKQIHYTDTTFRDAHQSLLATRVRTNDLRQIAESYSHHHGADIFSMEMWGGATFDVALRFLKECPWKRLEILRALMPNTLFQMLLRGGNAVGYKAYPDNLIEKFIEKSWEQGIDVFRIFDSFNSIDSMRTSIRAVLDLTDGKGIAEGCICYTGDILDPSRHKFTLTYYLDMAKRLEDEGIHILGIKDMAGLLKPYAAEILVAKLKETVSVPLHLHTHDTSGIQAATYLKAIEAGVDVIDVALSSMSGLTSQPNFNSIVAMMQGHERENKINLPSLNQFANYWEDVREYYYPFEADLKAGTAQVYENEIPGGQYSNLRPQARALGLEAQFETVKHNYRKVNDLFGDIVKVTPSSKVVGDMALFMTANGLTVEDVLQRGATLAFPDSVKEMMRGDLGLNPEGFPSEIQRIILQGETPHTQNPNEHLAPIDFEREFATFKTKFGEYVHFLDFLSYQLYPKVFEDFNRHYEEFGAVRNLPTSAFFYGLRFNEEILVEIDKGKSILVQFLNVTEANGLGDRTVFFRLNGQTRTISIRDKKIKSEVVAYEKVSDPTRHIGAPLQGLLARLLVKVGDEVTQGAPLFTIEAMKMESTIVAPRAGKIAKLVLGEKTLVTQDDLVVILE
jgi:pyruvate carboxylase